MVPRVVTGKFELLVVDASHAAQVGPRVLFLSVCRLLSRIVLPRWASCVVSCALPDGYSGYQQQGFQQPGAGGFGAPQNGGYGAQGGYGGQGY